MGNDVQAAVEAIAEEHLGELAPRRPCSVAVASLAPLTCCGVWHACCTSPCFHWRGLREGDARVQAVCVGAVVMSARHGEKSVLFVEFTCQTRRMGPVSAWTPKRVARFKTHAPPR